jgi:hypothetical protein
MNPVPISNIPTIGARKPEQGVVMYGLQLVNLPDGQPGLQMTAGGVTVGPMPLTMEMLFQLDSVIHPVVEQAKEAMIAGGQSQVIQVR